jgi:hypothetical protein
MPDQRNSCPTFIETPDHIIMVDMRIVRKTIAPWRGPQ